MDRRDFVLRTGALLAALGGGQATLAAEPKAEKDKKTKKKPATPQPPVAPFVPGSWTLVVLPDTQHYADEYPGLLSLQTQWIAENKKKHNIVYVLQNGDITHRRSDREWKNASRSFGVLDSVVPYALVQGNHDIGRRGVVAASDRTTKMNDHFPPSRFEKWPTFGGTMEPGHVENNYHLFEAGGKKWLLLGLEWAPRDATLDWAGEILDRHADRKALVFTHAYLYEDNTRYDWAAKGRSQRWSPYTSATPHPINDGQQIWQKLIRKHANVFMVMNGHVLGDGLGFQVSRGDHGNRVNEMLVNYQVQPMGGGAWLRLIEFRPDGKTIQAKSYSPLYDQYWTDPQNQFTMTIG